MDRLKIMYTHWKKSLKGEGMSQGKGGQANGRGGKRANALCPPSPKRKSETQMALQTSALFPTKLVSFEK